MKFYRKAETAAQLILEAFRNGDIPKAMAPVLIHRKDESIPCHQWSWSNQLLAAIYGAGDARGFKQWKEVGRSVKKGEKAFPIMVPCLRKRKEEDEETGEEVVKKYLYGFTSAPVFGIHQTEGEPLKDSDPQWSQWVDALPVVEVARHWGLSVTTYNGGKGAAGYYKHGLAIALGVENLSTWAHELIHAADDRNGTITKACGQQVDNEIVAELGGTMLLEILGYEQESDRGGCWEYIESYAKQTKKETITVCQSLLKRICDCVALVLDTADAMELELV